MLNYKVVRIPRSKAYPFIKYKHYLKRIPQIRYAFGLCSDDGNVHGVVTYGNPPSPDLCKGLCGEEYKSIVLELNRLYLDESCPKNSASYLVSQTFKMLPQPSIIVSYADGEVGHVGYIYQALNFLYTGLSNQRLNFFLDGKFIHEKTICNKFTNTKNIVNFYGDRVSRVKSIPKYRYVYFVGSKKDKKILRKALKYEVLPYPKDEAKRYEIEKTPLEMFMTC